MAIYESVETLAPSKKVWKAWAEMYHWKSATKNSKGFSGSTFNESGKKVPFKVVKIEKGKEFTTIFRSFLVTMKFKYELKGLEKKGSLIKCSVKFGGLLGWIAKFFLRKKIKKNLSESLGQFAEQMDMMQNRGKIRSF
jgi:hypothetical protein